MSGLYNILDDQFQSTPSVWRETASTMTGRVQTMISIHSLRVEGDVDLDRSYLVSEISIHSLRVEGDNPVR